MPTARPRFRRIALIGLYALVLAGCGGGSDEVTPDADAPSSASAAGEGQALPNPATAVPSAGEAGPVTLTSGPGESWVEIDGVRSVFQAAGTVHYECIVEAERASINYQTNDNNNMTLHLALQPVGWVGNGTIALAENSNVSYGVQMPGDGELGLGDGVMSFEGTASRVEDFDVANATDVAIKIAVNCAPPGGDPTATVAGRDFVFGIAGAQSFDCAVSEENVEIMVNRLSADQTNLQISARIDNGDWLGNVSITADNDMYTATFPTGAGTFTVDGQDVTYEGTFIHSLVSDRSVEEEVEGTATAACG